MLYAYALENKLRLYEVNNQPLFKIIRDSDLPENNIYIDDMGDSNRSELKDLKDIVIADDIVIIRSILDLGDTPEDIIDLLRFFGDSGVDIASVSEPYYEYDKNFSIVSDAFGICADLAEKKRRLGIEKATVEGRMGRKIDANTVDRVRRLKAADFTVQEIIKLCGISRSTYYRIIKNN